MKKVIFKLLILVCACLAGLIISEILSRIYFRKGFTIPKPIYIPHNVIGYVHNPNHNYTVNTDEFKTEIKINSAGFRDVEIPYKKKKNEKRFLFIGDSFTFGTGVNLNQIWHKIFINKLNNTNSNFYYTGINAGVGAYNTEHEYLMYKEIGVKYDPDYVVICILDNDILHNYKGINSYYNFALSGKEFSSSFENLPNPFIHPLKYKRIFLSKFQVYLMKYSYLFNYLYLRLGIRFSEKTVIGKDLYNKRLPGEFKKAWIKTESILSDLNNLCNKNKSKLIVIGLPQEIGFKKKSNDIYDYLLPVRKLKKICAKLNIIYFNAYKYLYNYADNPLYYQHDKHLNIYGNKVLGNEFYKFFIRNNM